MVVVLPAPFGPRKPVTFPGVTLNDRSLTAIFSPYLLLSPRTSIIANVPSGSTFQDCHHGPPSLVLSHGGTVNAEGAPASVRERAGLSNNRCPGRAASAAGRVPATGRDAAPGSRRPLRSPRRR